MKDTMTWNDMVRGVRQAKASTVFWINSRKISVFQHGTKLRKSYKAEKEFCTRHVKHTHPAIYWRLISTIQTLHTKSEGSMPLYRAFVFLGEIEPTSSMAKPTCMTGRWHDANIQPDQDDPAKAAQDGEKVVKNVIGCVSISATIADDDRSKVKWPWCSRSFRTAVAALEPTRKSEVNLLKLL